MRYHIWTVGCQMNVADSERMAAALAAIGGTPAARPQEADIVVLNTCSVRQAAEERALGKLNALRGLKRRRPDLIVALAGCMVGDDSLPDLQKRLPFVDSFIRPADVAALRETVRALAPAGSLLVSDEERTGRVAMKEGEQEAISAEPSAVVSGLSHPGFRSPLWMEREDSPRGPARWVPVIYGCNRSCSYCIVPARRGRERSRAPAEIEAEVRKMVSEGAREVRLLGQIVDRYGWDLPDKTDLACLFERLDAIEGLRRIRFLTSHPRDLRERVIEAIATVPKVCPDINIPFQAGDDAILKSMRRGYTSAFYRRLIGRIRDRIPGVALSTDVIVGYPGETAEQFQRTLDLLVELRFDVVHVAMYSSRPGTLAAELADDVPVNVKKERLRQVEEFQSGIASERNATLVGKTVEILCEGQTKGKWEGRTRRNTLVFFADSGDWQGRLALVRVEHAGAWSLSGRVVGAVNVAVG